MAGIHILEVESLWSRFEEELGRQAGRRTRIAARGAGRRRLVLIHARADGQRTSHQNVCVCARACVRVRA